MSSKAGQCPYHHGGHMNKSDFQRDSHALIHSYVEQFHAGTIKTLSLGEEDFAEKQQALFAYRIFQLSQDTNFFPILGEYVNMMIEESASYKEYTDEIKGHLQKMGENFFRHTEADINTISRLVAGLDTFHAFLKRVVMVSFSKGEVDFPYKLAVQFASTSLERANILAQDPDVEGWKGLFFDANYNLSKMYLGIPTSRPTYRCPVLYSGEFRTIIDAYYPILCRLWENSTDKPDSLNYF